MKFIILFITVLSSQIYSIAQQPEESECSANANYRFKSNISSYPELEINIQGEWRTYQFIDELSERFDYDCREIDLNGKGRKELVIWWSNAVYGTGGGLTTKGVQVWNLDNGNRLLNEITSCAEENFGRKGAKAYLVVCKKEIEILEKKIIVREKTCKTEWAESGEVPDPTSGCLLTTLDEGTYIIRNGELIKK